MHALATHGAWIVAGALFREVRDAAGCVAIAMRKASSIVALDLPLKLGILGFLRHPEGGLMARLLVVATAVFLAHQTARAADISVVANETADSPALILIKGPFQKNEGEDLKDFGTFSALAAAQKKPAVVFLDSRGGNAWTGIRIGLMIRRYGFSTAVADGALCASACAVAWMGGKERFMGNNAQIGFHAAWGKDSSEISAPNAIIGAYFHEVGIKNYDAIAYLTKAAPDAMTWLTPTDAIRYGIAVTFFSLSQDQWQWARSALRALPHQHIDPVGATFGMSEGKPNVLP